MCNSEVEDDGDEEKEKTTRETEDDLLLAQGCPAPVSKKSMEKQRQPTQQQDEGQVEKRTKAKRTKQTLVRMSWVIKIASFQLHLVQDRICCLSCAVAPFSLRSMLSSLRMGAQNTIDLSETHVQLITLRAHAYRKRSPCLPSSVVGPSFRPSVPVAWPVGRSSCLGPAGRSLCTDPLDPLQPFFLAILTKSLLSPVSSPRLQYKVM